MERTHIHTSFVLRPWFREDHTGRSSSDRTEMSGTGKKMSKNIALENFVHMEMSGTGKKMPKSIALENFVHQS
jgi:hypothetical protein